MPPQKKKNNAPTKPVSGTGPSGPVAPVTSDPRFKHLQRDPRFLRPKKKDMKVSIDKRFSGMLNSKEFGSGPKVDKYGRRLEGNTAEKELKRYYRIDDENNGSDNDNDNDEDEDEDEEGEENLELLEKAIMEDEGNREDEKDSDSEEEEKSQSALTTSDYMRGKGAMSSSDESSEDEEESDSDSETEDQPYISTGEETRRLAAVNMDWDKIKAVDILKVLTGFKPNTAVIRSVSIYPSEFGKERLAREDIEGPPKEIFNDRKEGDASDSEEEEEVTEASIIREQVEEGDGKEFDQEALRQYQRDRLKYYYAVIECDTAATAQVIYNACDGNEYESSANFFDLRYIPEDMVFEDAPKEVATVVPENHKPTKFITEALQHTKVKLTWDNDDLDRIQLTRREFTQEDIKELDFDAYLASSDEEEEEEDLESMREKYRKLLSGSSGKSVYGGKEEESDAEGDMEISFTPGLSEKKGVIEEAADKEETSIEKYMRKQKERRKAKKDKREQKDDVSDVEEVADMEEEMNDPYFKETLQEMEEDGLVEPKAKSAKKDKKKKKPSKEEREEQQRQKAELELLMADANDKGEGFDMKQILKQEKMEKKKGKKNKKNKGSEDIVADTFEIDVADPRFSALQESHHFAIDPTNPQFKKTKSMKKLLDARQDKMQQGSADKDTWTKKSSVQSSQPTEQTKEASLSQLVSAVKRKGAISTAKALGKRQKT